MGTKPEGCENGLNSQRQAGSKPHNHTLHTQVKAHRSGQALPEAGACGGLSVTPVPCSRPGLWDSIRQGQPGQHALARSPGKADTGLQRCPTLLLPDSHAFSSPDSGLPARASRGQQRSLTFSLKEKMFQKRAPPWGGLTSVGDGEEADLCPDNQAPLLSFSAPEHERKKKKHFLPPPFKHLKIKQ